MSYATVFRCLGLLPLVPAMLLFAAPLPAQEQEQEVKKKVQAEGKPAGLNSDGATTGGDTADMAANPAADGIYFDIRVKQDPMRIGPGESGNLILIVAVSAGDEIDPTGSLEIAAVQGPVRLAAGRWDSPPEGRMRHTDTFLIRVPLSVAKGTDYGKYPVSGEVKITGKFGRGGAAVLNDVINADSTGTQFPGIPVAQMRPIQQARKITKATGRFSFSVNVGAPMPKAAVPQQTRGATAEANMAKANGRSSVNAPGALGNVAKAENGTVEIVLPDARGTEDGTGLAPGNEPQAPDDLFGGIPAWAISLGLVAMAGLLFFMQKKG